MILYNITTQVSWAVHDAWKQWLTEEHLPAILSAGLFVRWQLVRLKEVNEDDGATYAVQLYCADIAVLDTFRKGTLPALQKNERDEWGDHILSFATVMEVIN